MPLYEYRCTKCQTLIELIQGFNDPPPKKCATCGAGKLEKVISRSGFVLKGGGWYQTDYKSGASTKGGSKDSGDSGDSKPGGDSADSKPSGDSADSKSSGDSADWKSAGNTPDSKPTGEASPKKKKKKNPAAT